MRILVYFSGEIEESKGTPIRVKNIIQQLILQGASVYYAGYTRPSNIANDHFMYIGNVWRRALILARYSKEKSIDIVYIQTSAGLWLAPLLQLLTSADVALDFHSLLIEEERVYKKLSLVEYSIRKYLDYILAFFLDYATGVSGKLAQYYSVALPIFHVLPGGVDLSVFNNTVMPDTNLTRWKGDSLLIGYAGNTKWYQGLDTVLSALTRLQQDRPGEYKLFIVASSLEYSVTEFIERNNLTSSVYMLGKQHHSDMPKLLAAADVLTIVRPSDMVTEYAFPSKFPEYAGLGRVLIISRVGDVQSYIVDGKNGVLVDPENVDQLYDKLLVLTDDSLRKLLAEGSAQLAREKLDINVIGKELYNFLYTHAKRK